MESERCMRESFLLALYPECSVNADFDSLSPREVDRFIGDRLRVDLEQYVVQLGITLFSLLICIDELFE